MLIALALLALVAVVQAAVWIGRPGTPGGRRLAGVFLAPVAVLVLALALASMRAPQLWR